MWCVQGCALALAVGLGLRSIAQVDGFVHADTGELIVRDVKAMPALTDGSPLLQQVSGVGVLGRGLVCRPLLHSGSNAAALWSRCHMLFGGCCLLCVQNTRNVAYMPCHCVCV